GADPRTWKTWALPGGGYQLTHADSGVAWGFAADGTRTSFDLLGGKFGVHAEFSGNVGSGTVWGSSGHTVFKGGVVHQADGSSGTETARRGTPGQSTHTGHVPGSTNPQSNPLTGRAADPPAHRPGTPESGYGTDEESPAPSHVPAGGTRTPSGFYFPGGPA